MYGICGHDAWCQVRQLGCVVAQVNAARTACFKSGADACAVSPAVLCQGVGPTVSRIHISLPVIILF